MTLIGRQNYILDQSVADCFHCISKCVYLILIPCENIGFTVSQENCTYKKVIQLNSVIYINIYIYIYIYIYI